MSATKEEKEIEDEDDPFANMLKLFPNRNNPPQPKRDRPKPFKQVAVTHPVKSTPSSIYSPS